MIIVSLIILFIVFLIWSTLMLKGKLDKFDNSFYERINITNLKTKIFKFITFLASAKFIAFLCLVLVVLIQEKIISILIILNMLLIWGLIGILKRIFRRERPNINRLVNEKGYSYPSGHTLTATNFYGFIIFLIIISPFLVSIKVILICLLSILILIVGFSRIYLGVHYLSDIIGGILFGTSYLLLYIFFTYFILNLI